ncbi:MAG: hypothetical protein GWN00_13415 [Aliifodinibius sp.]|nr:hypothetical protein [Fodinibius sp.]NIV93400.1 hypothetical protein [candidate division KSB1 bacterium]NIY25766.1 hypothetical protein [Fodinibius sp.]
MKFVVLDKDYNCLGLYGNRTKAIENCPNNGYIGIVPSVYNKQDTIRSIQLKIKYGDKPVFNMKTKSEMVA